MAFVFDFYSLSFLIIYLSVNIKGKSVRDPSKYDPRIGSFDGLANDFHLAAPGKIIDESNELSESVPATRRLVMLTLLHINTSSRGRVYLSF